MENNIAAESYAKVKKLASQDTSDYFANMMKGTTNGVITGGVLGLAIGFYKKYNLYGSAIGGMVLGGIAANFLLKYKN